MADHKIGTVFVELDLDPSRYMKGQQQLLKDAQNASTTLEKNFHNLGIKSDAIYDLMRAKAENSYQAILQSSKVTSNDIIRAEQAKSDKLKQIYEQQYGSHQSYLDRIKEGFQSITGHSLTAAAAITAAFATIGYGIKQGFEKGFQAVETYNQSVASLAAMVVTFTEREKGMDMEGQWKQALSYSSAMVPILENIAAKTLLSGQETTALANAFARAGVFLQANNEKQVEAFTRISNAIPLMTQGQAIMLQINQEIRGLMNGTSIQNSALLQTLKAIDPEISNHLKIWREEGTVMEHVGELLAGFGPATALLENQWQAVKSTIDTTVTQTLRGGMQGAYEDIIKIVQGMNRFLGENREIISSGIAIAWETVKNTAGAVYGIVEGFGPLMKEFGALTWEVAYGWGGIAAAAKPVGEAIGDQIKKMLLLGEIMVRTAKAAADVFVPVVGPGMAGKEIEAIKKAYAEFDKAGMQEGQSVAEALEAYHKRVTDAQKKITDTTAANTKFRSKIVKEGLDADSKTVKDHNFFKTIEDVYGNMGQSAINAFDKIRDEWEKLTMSAYEYEMLNIAQWFDKETIAIGGQSDALDALRKAKEENAKANESFRRMELSGGDPLSGAPALFAQMEQERLKTEEDVTEKINKLTLSSHDYKIWALDREVEKMRESANGKKAIIDDITEYQKLKMKEIEDEENIWLQLSKRTAEEMEQAFSTLFFDAMNGKMKSFSDLWKSMMQTIYKITSDYMGQIMKEMLFGKQSSEGGAIGGWIGSLLGSFGGFGSGAGGGAAAGATNMTGFGGGIVNAGGGVFGWHAGGVVGHDTPTFERSVNPAIFNKAPRLHTGLDPDEYPAILQAGERVLNRKETSEYRNHNKYQAPPVIINMQVNANDADSFNSRLSQSKDIIANLMMQVNNNNHPARRSR